MGINRVKPAQALREAVTVIRGLLHGETVDLQGQVIQCNAGHLHVTPRPDIPIILATRGNQVLRVAGEVADGVMISTYAEPTGIRYALSEVAKGAEAAHRRLEDLDVISRVDVCISENRREAIDAVKKMLGISLWTSYPDRTFVHCVGLEVPDELEQVIAKRDYNLMALNSHLIPDEFVEKFCWAGTAEEVAQKVAEVARMGIHQITFLPHPPVGGTVHETIRAFAQIVKPRVAQLVAA
jgi:5,10-methylenetetrahydromethanopterin reductase